MKKVKFVWMPSMQLRWPPCQTVVSETWNKRPRDIRSKERRIKEWWVHSCQEITLWLGNRMTSEVRHLEASNSSLLTDLSNLINNSSSKINICSINSSSLKFKARVFNSFIMEIVSMKLCLIHSYRDEQYRCYKTNEVFEPLSWAAVIWIRNE